jgi:diguanylate cyclase (GGDEF)-like protein
MPAKPTVLIVEDAPENIKILANCLKDKYELKIATTGEECLNRLEGTTLPDIILLDIGLPGMNGYDVCRSVKQNQRTKDIPIIFVTAKENDEEEEFGLTLGAVDYITKPIRPAIVSVRVDMHITLKQQRDKLESMAMYDQLTGLNNRHYLYESADRKFSRAKRHKDQLSLLMIDIDNFKGINDLYGHQVGDVVLQFIGKQLLASARQEDIVARFGGEEFIMLLDQCEKNQALKKAEELRQRISSEMVESVNVTASIGIAELEEQDQSFEDIIRRADKALYESKENGRDRSTLG